MANQHNGFWTPERFDDLKRLAGEGMTAAEIGRSLGCTRNAVIGKCHRCGVPLRERSAREGGIYAERAARKSRTCGASPAMRAKAERVRLAREAVGSPSAKVARELRATSPTWRTWDAPPSTVVLLDLNGSKCRWPVATGFAEVAAFFCGGEPEPCSSYCARHTLASGVFTNKLVKPEEATWPSGASSASPTSPAADLELARPEPTCPAETLPSPARGTTPAPA